MTLDRLRQIVDRISFGGFRPVITVEVTTQVTSIGERPAILISIETVDSASKNDAPVRLYECFAAPALDDTKIALWIKERCQDVLLHEMDEFFRFRDEMISKPVHPVAEGVFDSVRARACF